jgi:hypothetical protein
MGAWFDLQPASHRWTVLHRERPQRAGAIAEQIGSSNDLIHGSLQRSLCRTRRRRVTVLHDRRYVAVDAAYGAAGHILMGRLHGLAVSTVRPHPRCQPAAAPPTRSAATPRRAGLQRGGQFRLKLHRSIAQPIGSLSPAINLRDRGLDDVASVGDENRERSRIGKSATLPKGRHGQDHSPCTAEG